jgi:hypothetical protein
MRLRLQAPGPAQPDAPVSSEHMALDLHPLKTKRSFGKFRKGFKGLWDKLTFKYWTIRKENEKDAWTCHVRDREERQELIEVQLDQRQNLQTQFSGMRQRHEQEMQKLMADTARIATPEAERNATPEVFRGTVKEVDLGLGVPEAHSSQPRRLGRGKSKGHYHDM